MYVSRACDSCKKRKVKCDTANPCANCCISKLRCKHSSQPRKRGPRQRNKATGSEATRVRLQVQPVAQHNVAQSVPDTDEPRQGGNSERLRAFLTSDATREDAWPSQLPSSRLPGPEAAIAPSHFAPSSFMAVNSLSFGYDTDEIHTKLVARVEAILALEDANLTATAAFDLVNNCINLFLQYMFPNTPVAHERTLRTGASLFLPEDRLRTSDTTSPRHGHSKMLYAKDFSLVSALCAFVMSVMPSSLLPSQKELAGPFLQASRAMFRLYEEPDLEHPDSTSLTIRIWHSSAIQNMTGKAGAAWHYHTEASVLALRLRLYDEQAVRRAPAIESRLLRANFWLLYMSDKSAAALENRLSVLGEHLFEDHLTLLEQSDQHEPLLDDNSSTGQGALEKRINLGFHLKTRIWTAAGNLIADIKSYSRRRKYLGSDKGRNDVDAAHMTEANLHFSALTDNLPSWLQNPDSIEAANPRVAAYQKTCIWCQRSNIMTTYHCLRLVILQKCIDNDLLEIIGLSTQPLSWAMRKVDIVQDFLSELQVVPFVCYKVQGEAGVERIRRVGSLLLELVQNAQNHIIQERAGTQFEQLLDFLAKLDSKASDDVDNRP